MKPLILAIESATKNCSVALFQGDELIEVNEQSSDQYIHSEKLAVFIEDLFQSNGIAPKELQAVAVSAGPGSYTGLRIGVSAAKGLCFSADAKLLSIPTLTQLATAARNIHSEFDCYIPMLDARRMEVYASVFNSTGEETAGTEAVVVSEDSFEELIGKRIAICGDGAAKCIETLSHLDVTLIDLDCSARNMGEIAFTKFQNNDFENLAHFEPFYLKEFIAGKPKKLI